MAFEFKINKEVVLVNVEETDKVSILKKMADKLEKGGYVKKSFVTGILEREKIFPTGLQAKGFGVAIPHTDAEHVNSPMIAIATLKNPVKFNIMGGEKDETLDVNIIFMLAMKDGNAQVTLLQKLMSIIQDDKLLKDIYEANETDALLSILNCKLSN